MKKSLLLFSLYLLIFGCEKQKSSNKETVAKYYKSLNVGDFNALKTTINDSITLVAGSYIMPYNRKSFYNHFKWDSIFKPTYTIIELKEDKNQIIATVSQNCIRNAFLKNNPLTFSSKISFNNQKISKIEELEYKNVNWNTWSQQRDDLVDWIKTNYPKLDGFVNDMTMRGSQNYLKAIELYEKRKNNNFP